MKFEVKKEYRPISHDIIINPENSEVGILHRYIDVYGCYRESVSKTFQINAPENSVQGWRDEYKEAFNPNSQTKTEVEKYPVGTSWNDDSGYCYYTIEAIIHVYQEKLYVISDGGHQADLFGVNESRIDEVMAGLDFKEE